MEITQSTPEAFRRLLRYTSSILEIRVQHVMLENGNNSINSRSISSLATIYTIHPRHLHSTISKHGALANGYVSPRTETRTQEQLKRAKSPNGPRTSPDGQPNQRNGPRTGHGTRPHMWVHHAKSPRLWVPGVKTTTPGRKPAFVEVGNRHLWH
jgi:hypothetical protein